jgi:redox-sensitive bicupin YhaK (pirin superfamily)
MSAGVGITHSEYNNTKDPLSLYQLWIAPREKNVQPFYQEKEIGFGTPGLQTLIQAEHHFEDPPNGTLSINADAQIYYGYLQEGEAITHKLKKEEHSLIYVRTGDLAISHHNFKAGDQARITDEESLFIQAKEDTEFVMVTTW